MRRTGITANGIAGHPWDKEPVSPAGKEIRICKEWIAEWIDQRDTINPEYQSYALKHAVEAAKGQYVSNGAFIQAAIDSGYKYRQCNAGPCSPNACFNMSFKRLKGYLASRLGREARSLSLEERFKRIRNNGAIVKTNGNSDIVCHEKHKLYFVKHYRSGASPPGILGVADEPQQASAYFQSGYGRIKHKEARAFAKHGTGRYTYTVGGPDRLCTQKDYLSVVRNQKWVWMIQTHPPCPRVKC